MTEIRNWSEMRTMSARVLQARTGADVESWMERIRAEGPADEPGLRAWLEAQGVTGYARALLLRERFGYPDFMTASAEGLVDGQYADRPGLRPICDALIGVAANTGVVAIQARKTYVSLLTPRRTFARIQPTTRTRVDLGLRLRDRPPGGRLVPCNIHETMPLQVSLTAPEQVDAEVRDLLAQAYAANV
jgi:hypothetical protein